MKTVNDWARIVNELTEAWYGLAREIRAPNSLRYMGISYLLQALSPQIPQIAPPTHKDNWEESWESILQGAGWWGKQQFVHAELYRNASFSPISSTEKSANLHSDKGHQWKSTTSQVREEGGAGNLLPAQWGNRDRKMCWAQNYCCRRGRSTEKVMPQDPETLCLPKTET